MESVSDSSTNRGGAAVAPSSRAGSNTTRGRRGVRKKALSLMSSRTEGQSPRALARTLSGGGSTSQGHRVRAAGPLEAYVEKCLRITSPGSRKKMLARQRPADLASPRMSFCDFLGLNLDPKKTKKVAPSPREADQVPEAEKAAPPSQQGHGEEIPARASPGLRALMPRNGVSPALFAMKAKLAFIKACHSGDFETVHHLVAKLGVSVKQECMALHFASDANFSQIVRFLLSEGAHVDSKDSKNRTALMYAVYKSSVETVRHLLGGGADVEAQDDFGSTALMYAASGGSPECCRILRAAGASLDKQNKDGLSALIYAIQNNQPQVVRTLLDLGADPYVTNALGTGALHWAAKKGDVESCALLLESGVPVDALNNKKVTPLMYAADCVPWEGSNQRVMEFFIARGADIGALDEDMSSPLMYAAHSGSKKNVRVLLRSGAKASSKNELGTTPIMYAAYYGHLSCVCEFLKHDPDLRHATDERTMSVKDWASKARQTEIVTLLEKMSEYPLDWSTEKNAKFPYSIKENVRAFLVAANSEENQQLNSLPPEILLKIAGKYSELELWPMLHT